MLKLVLTVVVSLYILIARGVYGDDCRGRLANPGFINQRIKATYFFVGQALDGSNWYSCSESIPSNLCLYTLNPADARHRKWSESTDNQHFALGLMVQAGINLIAMSSWGEDFLGCACWVKKAAPMQTSAQAQTELFNAAAAHPLLIMPFLESRGSDSNYPWRFMDEFPTRPDGELAPGTLSQIINLIHRYLLNSEHPETADRWARVYDRNGESRYAVGILHAASNRLGPNDDAAFADGFDMLADKIWARAGVKVGFFLDIVLEGSFQPSPEKSGPFLANANSILGIQCFYSERFSGEANPPPYLPNEAVIYSWKRDFSRRWCETGIPFLVDILPGYDGHLVFTNNSAIFGHNPVWTANLTHLVNDYGRAGMVYNSWNGYTEAMVAVPIEIKGRQGADDTYYRWLESLNSSRIIGVDQSYRGPEFGTTFQPFRTVIRANNCANDGDRIQIKSGSYNEPLVFQRRLSVSADGGSVTIGN